MTWLAAAPLALVFVMAGLLVVFATMAGGQR